jgi:hypothetical protein
MIHARRDLETSRQKEERLKQRLLALQQSDAAASATAEGESKAKEGAETRHSSASELERRVQVCVCVYLLVVYMLYSEHHVYICILNTMCHRHRPCVVHACATYNVKIVALAQF